VLNKYKICVCTPYRADAEPRGPRHARAIAELGPEFEVVFVDCAPDGFRAIPTPVLGELANLTWITHFFPTRENGFLKLLYFKIRTKIAEILYRTTGALLPELFSPLVLGLEKTLGNIKADVYFAHNIELLLPAFRASKQGGLLMFDCMEYYSDMGEGQNKQSEKAVAELETKLLSRCALITTSSPQVGAAYEEAYGLHKTLSLYNCPSAVLDLVPSPAYPLRLYWRNSVLGISQRGLAEALDALIELPEEITLHLQGRLGQDGGKFLRAEIDRRNLRKRVLIHAPHAPDEAVFAASANTIGLCLERNVNRNHELTVSNKMFDYMMGGLAVVASDLPGLREVIIRSEGGLLFEPGSAVSLKDRILELHQDPILLERLRKNARTYSLREGNREVQMNLFKERVRLLLK
jgi:glycosyltransferase involved in cell wall biosynthesis